MYKLRIKTSFNAGHYLPWHSGKCKGQHGHTYHVEFVVGSEQLDEYDVVVDLGVLKPICRGIAGSLDHMNLNDRFDNPTVEVVSEWLYRGLVEALEAGGYEYDQVHVVEVTVWETDTGGMTYDGEN